MVGRNSREAESTLAEAQGLKSLAANLHEISNVFRLGVAGEGAIALHERMPEMAQKAALAIGKLLEEAVARGQTDLSRLFSDRYEPIANTRPQKHSTAFDALTDQLFPKVQEPLLENNPHVVYAIGCDRRGYVPTHNKCFSKALTGDYDTDFVGNRTKRIFDDPVGRKCGSHELPFLIQTYRRDTGEIMHDISSPFMFPAPLGRIPDRLPGVGSPPFFLRPFSTRPVRVALCLPRPHRPTRVAATATRVLRRGSWQCRLPSCAPCALRLRRATRHGGRRASSLRAGSEHSGCGRASCVCPGGGKLFQVDRYPAVNSSRSSFGVAAMPCQRLPTERLNVRPAQEHRCANPPGGHQQTGDPSLLLGINARTGRRETFGINVFKVREVMRTPNITAAPDMPSAVEGMVSLRGALVPVVDLGRYAGMACDSAREIMIVTEYNGHTQGFLVEAVDTILRLDWAQMRVPPDMMTANLGGLVTAVTELGDNRLVMMLDVEKVLAETTRHDDEHLS